MMLKSCWLLGLWLMTSQLLSAQNLTDVAVMNDRSSSQQLTQSRWSAMEDTVFLHPNRIRMDHRCLQIEGKDLFLLGGTMHYFRVAEPLWADRLQKIKAMGCNMVETYVPWNWHERQMPSSVDDFTKIDLGELDRFLSLAEQLGLYVILRPGPYICAEWKGGGFPQWLMRKRPKQMHDEVWLQSDNPEFVKWSEHWFKAVAKVVAPHQIWRRKPGTGGVILWQLENEYNRVKWVSATAKRRYLEQLAAVSRSNGIEVPFVTCWTSEARSCKSGLLNGCVDMVNSYPRWQIEKRFGRLVNQQLKTMPGKPLIAGELQGGWYSAIGGKLSQEQDGVSAVQTQNLALYALQRGFCALNFYMIVGGTNFDDWASREATATYDFAAAIGEDGSLTPRYDRIRHLAAFLMEHGTRIARAEEQNITAYTGDTLVHVAMRQTPEGDRYFFVRTEDHTHWHQGMVKVDGLSFSYKLEPFGSLVYYIPAGQSKGLWYPSTEAGEVSVHTVRRVDLQQIDVTYDDLPQRWKSLKPAETIDEHGIYGYHPTYYTFRANSGQLIEVARTGDKVVNGSLGDQVMVMWQGEMMKAETMDAEKISFRLPSGSKKAQNVLMLYFSPGMHHHINKSVEQHWGIGPRWVRLDGRAVRLRYAYTEADRGKKLSTTMALAKQGDNQLIRWFRYKFRSFEDGVYHLKLEHTGDGFVYVNGKCIGRCWQEGPQREYYIPECWLNKNSENIVAISLCRTGNEEQHITRAEIIVRAVRRPVINAITEDVEKVKLKIDKYVIRHVSDPEWILSRMAMYWKEGEHFTQCYIGGQRWISGEDNAPVPTLRLPGERTWNKWRRPVIEDLVPFNETGDLVCHDPNTGDSTLVAYSHTGHSVRSINGEIMQLAAQAAYVYTCTGDERYACFATDIFYQALLGIYYMKPVINTTPDDGEGKGGWSPGGILGYYDYEQIHDDMGTHLAVVYDYLASYLMAHPTQQIRDTGKDVRQLVNEVLRRFVDLGMVRGGRTGNWNVNGWDRMIRPIMVMESNSYFADGKGREYFLHYLMEESTTYHASIRDMLGQYDAVTGLWPESPGYGFGTVLSILGWKKMFQRAGIDITIDEEKLQKAITAIPIWSDYRGNAICFGDFRGGRIGEQSSVGKPRWKASSYSPFHRMVVLKNFEDPSFPMMACLYGGRKGSHLSPNGLAVQFYGFGYALAPDASAYESYWSKDYTYHQGVEGANTILQGYSAGDVKLNGIYPSIDTLKHWYATSSPSEPVQMADMTADEKRRTILMVKVGAGAGYYVDIFDPGLDTTDYVMHTVGTHVDIMHDGISETDKAVWHITDSLRANLWFSGGIKRKYTVSMNPSTYTDPSLTPDGVSTLGQPTPTVYAHQTAAVRYANVYEPYIVGRPCVERVKWTYENGQPVRMKVSMTNGVVDDIDLRDEILIERITKDGTTHILWSSHWLSKI